MAIVSALSKATLHCMQVAETQHAATHVDIHATALLLAVTGKKEFTLTDLRVLL